MDLDSCFAIANRSPDGCRHCSDYGKNFALHLHPTAPGESVGHRSKTARIEVGNDERGHFGALPRAAVSGDLETSCKEFLMPTRKYRTRLRFRGRPVRSGQSDWRVLTAVAAPLTRGAQRSMTTSVRGREQQMSRLPSAGHSSGSG